MKSKKVVYLVVDPNQQEIMVYADVSDAKTQCEIWSIDRKPFIKQMPYVIEKVVH